MNNTAILDIFKRRRDEEARQKPRDTVSVRLMQDENVQTVSPVMGDYRLENSELIFSAVSRIANALSAMRPAVYFQSSRVYSDPRAVLLTHHPNNYMTSAMFFRTMETLRLTSGNAYAIKVVDELEQPVRFDIIDPGYVTPFRNADTQELWYQISPPGDLPYFLHSWYVLHVAFGSANGITGINPIRVLWPSLEYDGQINALSVKQLQKGINAQVVLEAPANLGQDQRNKAIEDFIDTYKRTGSNILLLESGIVAKQLNLNGADSRKIETTKLTREQVAMVYNLPPHLMGDYTGTSYGSQEQQTLEFLTLTMLPIVTLYEQALGNMLFTRDELIAGWRVGFDTEALIRADSATRAQNNQISIRGGWKTPNEVRREYGLTPLNEGDVLLASRDLTPLRNTIREEVDNNANN